jgi:hypothetical protein
MAINDEIAYIDCGYSGIAIINISNVDNLEYLGLKKHTWPVEDMIIKDNILLAAASFDDFRVYKLVQAYQTIGLPNSRLAIINALMVITVVFLVYQKKKKRKKEFLENN